MAKFEGERRFNRRYQVHLRLHYCVALKGVSPRAGSTTTCDMSTGGLSFRSRKPFPLGAHIEVLVEWPARYRDGEPLELQLTGFVVRSVPGRTAARVTFWRFRTEAAETVRATA